MMLVDRPRHSVFREDPVTTRNGRLKRIGPEITQSVAAVERGNWPRMETLAANASRLQQELDSRKSEMALPCDVYVLVGREREWGKRQFCGYHVLRSGRHDLVSIARDDERDEVITRFAAVRREQMEARWL